MRPACTAIKEAFSVARGQFLLLRPETSPELNEEETADGAIEGHKQRFSACQGAVGIAVSQL